MKVIRKEELEIEQTGIKEGDELEIKMDDGTVFWATAIAKQDGKMLFVFNECVSKQAVNTEGGTEGGYLESDIRRYLNEYFLEHLPEELKTMLVPNNDGDELWLLSLKEVCGCDEHWDDCEGQLDYFKSEKNRVAEYEDETYPWWLRDVVSGANFANVDDGGLAASGNASGAYFGVRPAFAIEA